MQRNCGKITINLGAANPVRFAKTELQTARIYVQWQHKLQLQIGISATNHKTSSLSQEFEKKVASAKIETIWCQITIAT